ncbi:type II secretion system protein [bacterium]|jgi:prepilin-type N-terminal cleavage/methylation domain-containing protein|nr:type II secretion system protein [bacterium]MBT4335201.1 type II secretion system protein [bacterium]MBT4495987.1 type II secretion system protein [bacterium]MBT4763495.1 type II secretion system protein [bacterium]MBT5400866.1 type II secretion system protein [bacterium]
MNLRNIKGFTLTELLLVISIIALFMSSAAILFTSSREKGRDARRVSDISQMYITMELGANTIPGATMVGCDGAYDLTTSCTGPAFVTDDLSRFFDITGVGACNSTSVDVCDYSISKNDGSAGATVDDYQLCFYLEGGTTEYSAGLHAINNQGVITDCN